jgi:hypothetical protein
MNSSIQQVHYVGLQGIKGLNPVPDKGKLAGSKKKTVSIQKRTNGVRITRFIFSNPQRIAAPYTGDAKLPKVRSRLTV